jgi:hypothetical protein
VRQNLHVIEALSIVAQLFAREALVNFAVPLPENDLNLGLLRDPLAQVFVWKKDNAVCSQ